MLRYRDHVAAQSRTTHGAHRLSSPASGITDLLRRAILNESKTSLFTPRPWTEHPSMQDIASGGWRSRSRAAIRSSGYVIHTLEAALWAVDQTDGFEAAVVLAVNLGDDADTVGAVTGQLAGALYGASGIPQRWLEPLAWRQRIVETADTLVAKPSLTDPGYAAAISRVALIGSFNVLHKATRFASRGRQ